MRHPTKDKQDREKEFIAEAERLSLLDVQTQRDLIAMYRNIARTPTVGKADRALARERAQALERLLGLSEPSKQSPSV